jgi:alanine dehydrogenase
MEAEVVVVDKDLDKLRFIDQIHKGRIITLMSDQLTLEQRARDTDVLIGSVLVPGAKAPKLVSEEMVASMRPGSVVIDIAIDQGGCIETSHMTTHSDPTYALTNVTLPYALAIADRGLEDAVREDPALAKGVNAYSGELTNTGVAEAHQMESVPLSAGVDGVPE